MLGITPKFDVCLPITISQAITLTFQKDDSYLPIIYNPSDADITEHVATGITMRVLYDQTRKDFIIWPRSEGLHNDVMVKLGLDPDTTDNMGKIQTVEDYQKIRSAVGVFFKAANLVITVSVIGFTPH